MHLLPSGVEEVFFQLEYELYLCIYINDRSRSFQHNVLIVGQRTSFRFNVFCFQYYPGIQVSSSNVIDLSRSFQLKCIYYRLEQTGDLQKLSTRCSEQIYNIAMQLASISREREREQTKKLHKDREIIRQIDRKKIYR